MGVVGGGLDAHRDDGRADEYLISWRGEAGEAGGPRSPCDEWCCKNIYTEQHTVGYKRRGDVLPSFLPSFFHFVVSMSGFLLPVS